MERERDGRDSWRRGHESEVSNYGQVFPEGKVESVPHRKHQKWQCRKAGLVQGLRAVKGEAVGGEA